MPRPSSCILRQPRALGPPWLALSVTVGAYPNYSQYGLYYLAQNFPLSMPVHAFTAVQDWWNSQFGAIQSFVPLGDAINVGPVYLWDGSIVHTYGNIPLTSGINTSPFSPRTLGLCIKKECNPTIAHPYIHGRIIISPVPETMFDNNGRITRFGFLSLTGLVYDWFTPSFTSEGNTWAPAVLHQGNNQISLIERAPILFRTSPFRRRARNALYEAHIHYPLASPTSLG